jgi:type I restriction enzyme S subunit
MKTSWHELDLASVVSTLESGSRPKGGATTETGEIASLGGENIVQSGGVTLAEVKRVPKEFFNRMTKGHLIDGDVLINKDGAQTGKVGIYLGDGSGPACINEHVFLIRGNREKISQNFLYYMLLSEFGQRQIVAQISGSAQPGLKSSFLKGVVTDIPDSLPEQTKIAVILSTVDRAIEQTESLIAKQQRIKTGLMQDLLTRGIDEHGNLRSEQTHRFKDSKTPLGRIPVEWEVKRLGDSSEVCNSYRKPIAALVRENMKGDYPYYGPTGVLDYIYEYRVDGKFVLIGEDGDHFLKYKTQEMTLLIEGKYNVNNHAHILRGKGNILTEWLHLYFLHRDITLHLTRQGAGRFKLNKAALLELLLSVPKEPAEQDRILKVMNILRQEQNNSIENLAKLRSLKTALMQDLLTGKKRVTPLLTKPQEAGA